MIVGLDIVITNDYMYHNSHPSAKRFKIVHIIITSTYGMQESMEGDFGGLKYPSSHDVHFRPAV